MILDVMLKRLYQSLLRGPSLNAKPHNSRQRIDLLEIFSCSSLDGQSAIQLLLSDGQLDIPAEIKPFIKPDAPAADWTDAQKQHKESWDKQARLLRKLSTIATDARDYFNDHGDDALFIGFPMISVPPTGDPSALGTAHIIAPIAMIPIRLVVRMTGKRGITIRSIGEGADRLVANPALLSYVEQITNEQADDLYTDVSGSQPWDEINSILEFIGNGLDIENTALTDATSLVPFPEKGALPNEPILVPSAVLGLFPMKSPGMIRDTRWMRDNEHSLKAPVKSFLTREALEVKPELVSDVEDNASAEEQSNATKKLQRDFANEFIISRADPCQANAVTSSATSPALVIHGAPGTGKSQTIANIIGDHLARGQRVLFVCDKRTALDVVKFRLDAMGLGHLCGVIHDPKRDRKDFYMSLRENLENLPNTKHSDRSRKLANTNEKLTKLHTELMNLYDSLHGEEEGKSFHNLVGQWLSLTPPQELEFTEDTSHITSKLVEQNRINLIEIADRLETVSIGKNRLYNAIDLSLDDYFQAEASTYEDTLQEAASQCAQLSKLDSPLPLDPEIELEHLTQSQEMLAEAAAEFSQEGVDENAAALFNYDFTTPKGEDLMETWYEISPLAYTAVESLDSELEVSLEDQELSAGKVSKGIYALEEYLESSGKWNAAFALGRKANASEVLAKYGLKLTPENAEQVLRFYNQKKAHHVLVDFLEKTKRIKDKSTTIAQKARSTALAMELLTAAEHNEQLTPMLSQLREGTLEASWAKDLQASAERAYGIHRLIGKLQAHEIFNQDALNRWDQELRSGDTGEDFSQEFTFVADKLEDLLRAQDSLSKLPSELAPAARVALAAKLSSPQVVEALDRLAIENTLRQKLADGEQGQQLSRIDSIRVEATFKELNDLILSKRDVLQDHIRHLWHNRQTKSLVADNGSKLNANGTSLKQRLYIRGQKALGLRQMIDTGSNNPDGDPLYDMCPVWMASPDTVVQIFKKEPFFDICIFDEASQCRIEEALPVLLRAKRLVVAGDPKQLPPTRFFEGPAIEAEQQEIKDEEDLHQQQMSDMEDLLGAALNINVDQAFLDVHYRSQNEHLIGFANEHFYGGRLQAIPCHPKVRALGAPIKLINVDGLYANQSNPEEATAAVEKVVELLNQKSPPSIGIATFNLKQRNLILEKLDTKAAEDPEFSKKLAEARERRGEDSFEGLFVKNIENVQGDERDVLLICTTFGKDSKGAFRRNFGALSQSGGERRLNVLITRARSEIILLTSIPREEYQAGMNAAGDEPPNGRVYLYGYLLYAEQLRSLYGQQSSNEKTKIVDSKDGQPLQLKGDSNTLETQYPSPLAQALGSQLALQEGITNTVHWGNNGFLIDLALHHPKKESDVTIGIFTDFNRFRDTSDPIDWELFRASILRYKGWKIERHWSPRIFRDCHAEIEDITKKHK